MLLLRDVLFSPVPGEMIQFDEHRFQMGWLKPPTFLFTNSFGALESETWLLNFGGVFWSTSKPVNVR